MISYKVAFTGHRPNGLYGYDMNAYKYIELELKIEQTIRWVIQKYGSNDFYTGGALGFDTLVAKILINFRKNEYPNIQDYVCVPFREQYKALNKEQIKEWLYIVNNCYKSFAIDTIEGYTCDKAEIGKYHPYKMELRNQYMVDNCDILIACWNEEKHGGTYNCVRYALENNKKVLVINPQTLKTNKINF